MSNSLRGWQTQQGNQPADLRGIYLDRENLPVEAVPRCLVCLRCRWAARRLSAAGRSPETDAKTWSLSKSAAVASLTSKPRSSLCPGGAEARTDSPPSLANVAAEPSSAPEAS
eukprot:scaffold121875_cov44-Prasinocladus_malaysianus.AAC.4